MLVSQSQPGLSPFGNVQAISEEEWNAEVQRMQAKLDAYDASNVYVGGDPDFDAYQDVAPHFDSKWYTGSIPVYYKVNGGPLKGSIILGNDLNYYFQGMLAKHYHVSYSKMIVIIWGWKLVNYSATPTDDALRAAELGWELSPERPN